MAILLNIGVYKKMFKNLFKKFRREWKPAFVKDGNGEVFKARYIETNGRVVIRLHVGRLIEGFPDGKTSLEQIPAWWPDKELELSFERVLKKLQENI